VDDLSAEDVREIGAGLTALAAAFGDTRAAIVAPDALIYGLARMSTSHMDAPDLNVQVFNTREAAEAWLRS
jgi:hypothetical protein